MGGFCSECKLDISADECVSCDSCTRLFHRKPCSGLNASEIKVMELKGSRTLKFFCKDCQSGLKIVPELIKVVDELRQEIVLLKKTSVSATNTNKAVIPSNSYPASNSGEADILMELQERQKRANNVMLFNFPEGNDKDNVKDILSILWGDDPPQAITYSRIGKPNKNNNRALKITLDTQITAEKLIKNGYKLKGKKVFIGFDLTPKERDEYKFLQTELKTRREKGENVVIRYQNRVPRIVTPKNGK